VFKISVTTKFAAAHQLRGYQGPCENLHGHNWVIKATVGAERLDDIGMVYDFKKLKNHLSEIIERFDHQFLNKVKPFNEINPTSENLAKYIFESLAEKLPPGIKVVAIDVGESEQYVSSYEAS
jgi:6-pyruvoyltetrahydropterin/6-carboxytetrahydropterin synthase